MASPASVDDFERMSELITLELEHNQGMIDEDLLFEQPGTDTPEGFDSFLSEALLAGDNARARRGLAATVAEARQEEREAVTHSGTGNYIRFDSNAPVFNSRRIPTTSDLLPLPPFDTFAFTNATSPTSDHPSETRNGEARAITAALSQLVAARDRDQDGEDYSRFRYIRRSETERLIAARHAADPRSPPTLSRRNVNSSSPSRLIFNLFCGADEPNAAAPPPGWSMPSSSTSESDDSIIGNEKLPTEGCGRLVSSRASIEMGYRDFPYNHREAQPTRSRISFRKESQAQMSYSSDFPPVYALVGDLTSISPLSREFSSSKGKGREMEDTRQTLLSACAGCTLVHIACKGCGNYLGYRVLTPCLSNSCADRSIFHFRSHSVRASPRQVDVPPPIYYLPPLAILPKQQRIYTQSELPLFVDELARGLIGSVDDWLEVGEEGRVHQDRVEQHNRWRYSSSLPQSVIPPAPGVQSRSDQVLEALERSRSLSMSPGAVFTLGNSNTSGVGVQTSYGVPPWVSAPPGYRRRANGEPEFDVVPIIPSTTTVPSRRTVVIPRSNTSSSTTAPSPPASEASRERVDRSFPSLVARANVLRQNGNTPDSTTEQTNPSMPLLFPPSIFRVIGDSTATPTSTEARNEEELQTLRRTLDSQLRPLLSRSGAIRFNNRNSRSGTTETSFEGGAQQRNVTIVEIQFSRNDSGGGLLEHNSDESSGDRLLRQIFSPTPTQQQERRSAMEDDIRREENALTRHLTTPLDTSIAEGAALRRLRNVAEDVPGARARATRQREVSADDDAELLLESGAETPQEEEEHGRSRTRRRLNEESIGR